MQSSNVIRSLLYLEEKCKAILEDCRIRNWKLSDLLSKHDFDSFWKFYKELIPYLHAFAVQENNDQISAHNKLFAEYYNSLEDDLNRRQGIRIFGWSPFESYSNMDTFEQIFRDLSNNISNLIYQIRIDQ